MKKAYQYIGTNLNLEENCIQDMNEELTVISRDDALKIMGITEQEADNMFPMMKKQEAGFYTSTFDNENCLVYQINIGINSEDKMIQFIWIEI